MTKLFNRAFASIPEDVKRDDELYEKMALVQQFIRPESLDIKPTFRNETSWLVSGANSAVRRQPFRINLSLYLLVH